MPKIGTLELKNRFLLAPMLKPNDIAFRLLCKKAGAALTYTGMVSPLSKQKLILDDKPAVQIFGNTPKGIAEFIEKYDKKVGLWDFNLGCPSKLSKKLSHGAFMHKDLDNIGTILKTMRKATKKPISIKIRKSPQALDITKIAEEYCDAIGIHPRTSEQAYSREPDYNFALELKKKTSIPIIYSGDVSEKNAWKILKDFDFVFIGRAATGNPDIFSRLLGRKSNLLFKDYLNLAKDYDISFRQIKYQAICFSKGESNAKSIRRRIIPARDVKTLMDIYKNK